MMLAATHASAPPTPMARQPRPLALGVCESVPSMSMPGLVGDVSTEHRAITQHTHAA
jgi:hypothetical protein